MKVLFFVFVLTSVSVMTLSSWDFSSNNPYEITQTPDPKLKARALVVLKNKCNVCHKKENKSVIFSDANMVKKSKKIYKMVFIKKKMPKDDVTLTTSERKDLQLWLDSLNP